MIDSPRNITPSNEPMMTEGRAGVLPFRLLERRYAVRDGFDTGDRRAARRERVQYHCETRADESPDALGLPNGTSPVASE